VETAGETRVVRCSCGLLFVTPRPARPEIAQAYDEAYYRPWHDQSRRRARMWERRMRQVQALAPLPGRLLDIGCATGEFLHAARARGWTVSGTELSAFAVTATRGDGLSVQQGEVWEAGFAAGAFDVVTCWHVIEHASDPRRMIEEIHRVLRPGGWLLLATPNPNDLFFRTAYLLARGRRPRRFVPGERELHLFFFSARALGGLVRSAGFEIARIGFDRGAAIARGKHLINEVAYAWFRLTGVNWGMGLELIARRPLTPQGSTDG
jgi:SAM-dependent methyltransferase